MITATRGDLGTLGQDGKSITREELPRVRESELRAVMELINANPPIVLDYRDQELDRADQREVSDQILVAMEELRPEVVITWGPTGISKHVDHIAIHKAAVDAFHRYRRGAGIAPRLYYVAFPKEAVREFGLEIDGPEIEPTAMIDIDSLRDLKVQALRLYQSQQDAQEVVKHVEDGRFGVELFHQAYPPHDGREMESGFWQSG